MSESVILFTANHPLADLLEKVSPLSYEVPRDGSLPDLNSAEIEHLYDFCLFAPEKKLSFLKTLKGFTLTSDLSLYPGDLWLELFPYIQEAFSLAFFTGDKEQFEFFSKKTMKTETAELFKELNLSPLSVESPGLGFTFPRTLSMIIGEAFFALDEGISDPTSIDTAMKFGVNYPKGPLEWAEQIGEEKIYWMLRTLRETTGDPRYKISLSLQKKAYARESHL